ncbi:MAG: SCO family protein [Deltaproteobacteria bacterium]|nr:SCO family protein [Deltaproteobacteria bacterium]
MRMRQVRQVFVTVGVLVAITVGFRMMQKLDTADDVGAISATARVRGITLVKDDGVEFRLDANGDRWMILFFGYASCPDVCPMSLAYLNRELTKAGPAADTFQPVFVSVDPGRDSPEVLKRYVAAFSSRIVGATGSPEMLEKLAKQLGVYYEVERSDDGSRAKDTASDKSDAARTNDTNETNDSSYTIVHSGAFFIVDPRGKLIKTLSPPQAPGALSAIITQIHDQNKV